MRARYPRLRSNQRADAVEAFEYLSKRWMWAKEQAATLVLIDRLDHGA